MSICNFCGGTDFIAGPNGRLAANNTNPQCKKCASLERHRLARNIVLKLKNIFSQMRALQLSEDMSLDSSWFKSFEISIYNKENSVDIQKIDRADKTYDFIFCNHVLEHVKDDSQALLELSRITSDEGFTLLMVPFPTQYPETIDWGYPHPEYHGHYRVYGKNFKQKLKGVLADCQVLYVEGTDPVTMTTDACYIITRSLNLVNHINSLLKSEFQTELINKN